MWNYLNSREIAAKEYACGAKQAAKQDFPMPLIGAGS
jgi:hypothetical protein